MGTYRQPSQIIDKRFNTLNQGLQNASQTMVNGLREIRAQEIAMAKEAKKEQEKRDKERKAFEAKRNAAVDGYRVKIDNWEHINQKRTEDWQAEDVAIDNQLKNNALYYLDIMSNSTEGDDNYRSAKRAIENMIIQYPVMAQLLNDESEELGEAFYENGAYQRKATEANALLLSEDPLYDTKKNMLYDIKYGRNPDKFQVIASPSGFSMIYTDDDGKQFDLDANAYQQYKEGGNDLIGSTNEENYNTFMDATWGIVGQDYKGIENVVTKYKKDIASGNPVEYRKVVESYNKANEGVRKNIEAWVNRGGTVTQSQWQLLGNETIYNPTMKEELIDQLYNAQIERYGKDDKYKLSEEEIIRGGGRGAGKGEEVVDLSKINLSDVENIITDTRKEVADYRKTPKPSPAKELDIRKKSADKIADILNDEFKNEILKFGDEKIEIDSFDVKTDTNGNFIIQPLEISRGKLAEAGVSYIIKDFDDLNKFKQHLLDGDKNISRVLEVDSNKLSAEDLIKKYSN